VEKRASRCVLFGVAVVLLLSLASISLLACPYSVYCPMHSSTNCTGTGRTKYVNGKQWGEFQCPGLGSDAAHTFWVQCD
jgi:hypothetical protein